jgi:hypothetical protein
VIRRLAFLPLAVFLVALAAGPAFAQVDFRTPGKAAYCYIAAGEVAYSPDPPLVCYTPADGFTVRMRSHGRATKRYVAANKWNYDYAKKLLGFGQSWWASDSGDNIYMGFGTPSNTSRTGPLLYRCWSKRSGLQCLNRTSHGWWLGPYGAYRVY